jgi:Na+/proline symporter
MNHMCDIQQITQRLPSLPSSDNLLNLARGTTLPFTLISTLIAAFYKNSGSAAGATGYLLIVAFDIVLATVVVPLFGCYYCKNPSPRAALVGILAGVTTRVVLEFALPKDGLLLLPFDDPEFLDVGPAASSLLPTFIDADEADYWVPETEPCTQETFKDFTGVDSLAAPLVNLFFFLSIQTLEHFRGKALFEFGGSEGYIKDTTEHPLKKDNSNHTGPDGGDDENSDEAPSGYKPRKSVMAF